MAENTATSNTPAQRRRVSVIGVLFALIFLAVASVGFTGDPWWLFTQATKWVVAGVIAVIGVSLLATALPGRQRNKAS